jgi:thymidylate kinase
MGLEWLRGATNLVKRMLGQDPAPALRSMGREGSAPPASRRGAVGWLWALVVVASYLVTVRVQHRRARGVVIYDRHLLDALATVQFAYRGPDLRLHTALIRRLLPRADVSVYLEVTAEVSIARKPDPTFTEHAVRRQLEEYAVLLAEHPDVIRLDATQPPAELARTVLRLLLDAG